MEESLSESTPVDLFPQALPKIPSDASCPRYQRKLSVREIKIQRSEAGNKYAAFTRHSRAKRMYRRRLSVSIQPPGTVGAGFSNYAVDVLAKLRLKNEFFCCYSINLPTLYAIVDKDDSLLSTLHDNHEDLTLKLSSYLSTVKYEKLTSVALWKTAFSLISSRGDPWEKFHLQELPEETAKRYRYNAIKGKWIEDIVRVKIENSPFNRGAMRECFRAKKLSNFSHCSDWSYASNHVAKRYIEKVETHVYFDDVRLQMDAKLWGEEYSRQPSAPKKVDISQMCVLEFINRPEKPLYHLEHFIEGTYRKYNSNSGFVDDLSRNTPQVNYSFIFLVELSGTVAIPASRRDRYGIRRLVSENIDSSYDLQNNANNHNNDTSSDFVNPIDFVESHSVPSPKLPFLPSRSPVLCRNDILQKTDQINHNSTVVANNGKHNTKYNNNTTTTDNNNGNNDDARTDDSIFGPISLHNNSYDSGISFDGPS
ncbi:elongation factor 2 kinase, partial [Schistosoma bovis]